jgi:hypothetical protein
MHKHYYRLFACFNFINQFYAPLHDYKIRKIFDHIMIKSIKVIIRYRSYRLQTNQDGFSDISGLYIGSK